VRANQRIYVNVKEFETFIIAYSYKDICKNYWQFFLYCL